MSTESHQVGAVRESSVCERGSVSHQVGAVRAYSMCERGTVVCHQMGAVCEH